MNIDGKVIVITGAARGIGQEYARYLGGLGARIVAADINDCSSTLDLVKAGHLEFCHPDLDRFPCLRLAYQALRTGGTLPCVLNAANEIAVEAFLNGTLSFTGIAHVITRTMEAHRPMAVDTLDTVLEADRWARAHAGAMSAE